MLALLDARAGKLSDARTHVEAALAVAESATMGRIAIGAAALVAGGPLADDDLIGRAAGAALAQAALFTGINSSIGRYAGPYARWLSDRGHADDALGVLRDAMRALHSPYGATDTLLAAIALGDRDARRAAIAFLETLDARPEIALYAATAAHMRALDARRSNADCRPAALEAATRYSAMGWHYYEATCYELAGNTEDAARAFRAMGALADVRRLELGAVHDGPVADRSGLSAREWEIAGLIAAGASNKMLAQRLFISQKTVEKHLTAIYAKLGFRSRSELAAFVARRSG